MLAPLADVRPGERRGAVAAFLTLFGILAGHTLLETARDALFLARLPPSQLPWVYLAMAAVAIAISQGPWRAPRGWAAAAASPSSSWPARRRHLRVLAAGHSSSNPWALRALYVWTGILGTLAALQFWIVLGELYTVTQAKRIYKLVGTGALLGAVAGAALARVADAVLAAPAPRPGLRDRARPDRPRAGDCASAGRAAAVAARRRPRRLLVVQTVRLFRDDPLREDAGRAGARLHRRPHPRRLRLQEHGRADGPAARSWARSSRTST